MTFKKRLKKELMVFAINHDYFGYGSSCIKRSDGKYISYVDGEKAVYTATQLAEEYDGLEEELKKTLIQEYGATLF